MNETCDYCRKKLDNFTGYIVATFVKYNPNPNVVTILGQLYFCNEACQINYNKGFSRVTVKGKI